ncbi:hypothetical protein HH310_41080 [Actinoplanes sp. TBRC 11911]|uniref:hypothetical protein n=1 Tax=Actinoplanes sp. TBRC 11911 TaxID=2729386 RepID=UPI00145EBCC3|nr:hypothetical protein [Actinoplanes sp. TBRC 11911]NMO57547.1 hypothetical protein [Actinoplanes sp. TBRC 11911]
MTANTGEAELAAARLLLQRMGISLDDLIQTGPQAPMPTFAEYTPKVRAAVSAGLLKAYGTYWDKVVAAWGERHLERRVGTAIARAYAGHTDGSGSGSTALYVKAGLPEVAAALAAITGEAHPAAVDQ